MGFPWGPRVLKGSWASDMDACAPKSSLSQISRLGTRLRPDPKVHVHDHIQALQTRHSWKEGKRWRLWWDYEGMVQWRHLGDFTALHKCPRVHVYTVLFPSLSDHPAIPPSPSSSITHTSCHSSYGLADAEPIISVLDCDFFFFQLKSGKEKNKNKTPLFLFLGKCDPKSC